MRRPALQQRVVACIAVLVASLGSACAVGDYAGEGDSFPGWLGVSSRVRGVSKKPATPKKVGVDMSRVIELSSWKPRAYLYKGFLSEEECDHIMSKAEPRLVRSSVANNNDGHSEVSEIRTSSGMFIQKAEDPVIKGIEERVSEWTFLPTPNQEAMQVLKYDVGQKYEPHVDYFHDPVNSQRGGHRYATVLMYLNNVTRGGETVFPLHKDPTPKDDSWSQCAKGQLAVKPQKGDALLFFSMLPDGTPDDTSMHYACPVVEGTKWSAPMWIHVADFTKLYHYDNKHLSQGEGEVEDDGSGCSDTNALCRTWAVKGECKRNPAYMLQACRKSCRQC